MDERMEFIVAYQSGLYTVTELADQFGISRKTAYKQLERFRADGITGLNDRSRRPARSPLATSEDLVKAVVACRHEHPRWGPKKLHRVLTKRHPARAWPAVSTMALILKREGLAHGTPRAVHRAADPTRPPFVAATAPNVVWTLDFKGQFRTGDTRWCYPLTIMDRYSRYLLECRHRDGPTTAGVKAAFIGVFREVGLPQYLHSDNGEPFVGHGLAGLSDLAVWWLRLGIWPELGRPAHPEDNPEHERMHRTLKADTARPPAASGPAQQRRFTRFRQEYNWDRPHEALGLRVPGEVYTPSPRPYPPHLPEVTYPGHYEVRRVSSCGRIKWDGEVLFLSTVLRHQPVGVEEVDDGVWDLFFGPARLGRFDQRTWHLVGARHLRPRLDEAP
jgi:putative transposase